MGRGNRFTCCRLCKGPDPEPDRTVPIRLAAKVNALGLRQISCESMHPRDPQSRPLEFNLRPHEDGSAAMRN